MFSYDAYLENAKLAETQGLYNPDSEHDACGVGFIAAIDGKPRREILDKAIEALGAVWHRGAVDSDGKTGDGAGLKFQIPQEFFIKHIQQSRPDYHKNKIAVGQIFLPRLNLTEQETARTIVEREVLAQGYSICGWRQVPVNVSILGDKAKSNRPEIEQIMISNRDTDDNDDVFERNLYFIRRRIEKAILTANIDNFYICSLSCRDIIYKGMFLAQNIAEFYPDLLNPYFITRYAIFHQRYSTNTYPQWKLAQPFRMLAHNGEINTLHGNVNWMKSHEIKMASDNFGDSASDIKPIIQPNGSDSANLDNVFEVIVRAGRSAPWAKSILVPPAWRDDTVMPEHHKALFMYANSVMEPWDGPAALVISDGDWICAGMDRNGLRPFRYAITHDGLLVCGSEAGMVKLSQNNIAHKGRLGPGKMLALNLAQGKIYDDTHIKDLLSSQAPYKQWLSHITSLDNHILSSDIEASLPLTENLNVKQSAFGFTHEDLELVLDSAIITSKEVLGSMGDDTPHAVLSKQYRPLSHFFRQRFSQVTNPPIDALREAHVMSLMTRFGNLQNVLDESEAQLDIYTLESPVLTNGMYHKLATMMGDKKYIIDCTFDKNLDNLDLRHAINAIVTTAIDAVKSGHKHLILTDDSVDCDNIAIPMILAVGAVHSGLVKAGLRSNASINVRSGECLDSHYLAVLIGVGATTVNPYLICDTIRLRHQQGKYKEYSVSECLTAYKKMLEGGLLKILSKSGISVLSSYRGGYNFEVIGLSRALVSEFFPGLQSRISGIGFHGILKKILEQHTKAFDTHTSLLPIGGFYRYRTTGEQHALDGGLIHLLQTAVTDNSYELFKQYAKKVYEKQKQDPIALRDLLDYRFDKVTPIALEYVESVTEIRKKFVTPGMSLGALSPEAHETLAIAMNRIGAKSDSGEGGEDPSFANITSNGDNRCSAIKQVASGRFGVTAEYLNNCRELEIKVAQGAKPGEGGQLPDFKVTALIAKLRHSTEGVTLISPPPHHDIYSIEDLAQLIYDLKQINPTARVCVKLVSQAGIGTVAAGVVKAMADVILISGNVGGTAASPLTSIKFAGSPMETGLAEVNQVLTLNNMRHKVVLRSDGGLKTGRDIVTAALLGAEEFGIGTAALVAMGCIMVRQCHSNTCPVGVCTQDDELRKKFGGSPEKVINLFTLIAEEVREILASLGLKSLRDAVGRTDLLTQVNRGWEHLDDLDLNPLLLQIDTSGYSRYCTLPADSRNEVPDNLDTKIIQDAEALFKRGEKMELSYNILNTDRTIGTRTASNITRKFGMSSLNEHHLTLRLRGSAGQSLGAFTVQGMTLIVYGEANDYVGKGLSGGMIIVRQAVESVLVSHKNTIIGNTVLYGATSGYLFAAGQAGERFGVRNSGANAVIEGCGTNGLEYMTGGIAVILGDVGLNFAAGMTGGMAFVYDEAGTFDHSVNTDTVVYNTIQSDYWEGVFLNLVKQHADNTGSNRSSDILMQYQQIKHKIYQICPKDMVGKLKNPLSDEGVGEGRGLVA